LEPAKFWIFIFSLCCVRSPSLTHVTYYKQLAKSSSFGIASATTLGVDEENAVIRELAESDFQTGVLQSDVPVLVAFGTAWSKPCKILIDTLQAVAEKCAGMARVCKVDVDENPDLGLWYGISSVPTLIWFAGGKPQTRIVGTATAAAILSRLPA
jgi:thioredoxin 1